MRKVKVTYKTGKCAVLYGSLDGKSWVEVLVVPAKLEHIGVIDSMLYKHVQIIIKKHRIEVRREYVKEIEK